MSEDAIPQRAVSAADANRALLAGEDVLAVNLLAGSGSGKTAVILATIEALRDEFNIAVVQGDAASNVNAKRIAQQGIAAVAASTEGETLAAADLSRALESLDPAFLDLVIIENVGDPCDVACPDLGEGLRVVIQTAAEGERHPLDCADAVRSADAVILNKADTIHQHGFNLGVFEACVHDLNPSASIFLVSATKNEGVEPWALWLRERILSC